jgi:hypothetical protein
VRGTLLERLGVRWLAGIGGVGVGRELGVHVVL